MKKFILTIVILSILIVTACENGIEVKVDGGERVISEDVFELISNKDKPTVKLAILPDEKGNIEIEYLGILYKIFQFEDKDVVYFKDGQIYQYELTKFEVDKVEKALRNITK